MGVVSKHQPGTSSETLSLSRRLALAETLLRRGQAAEAARAFREILADASDHPAALNGLGIALKAVGELTEAEQVLRRAAAAMPRDPAPLNNLGNVLRARRDSAGAVLAYRQALAIDFRHVESHYNLGVALEDLGRTEEALASYQQVARLDRRHARALTRTGALLHDRKRYMEALVPLDQAVAAHAEYFDARYYRGRTLSALGRHDEALAELAQATQQRPASFEAAFAHALALRDANRYDEALAALAAVAERWPGEVATHSELNRLAWARGRRDLFMQSFALAKRKVLSPDLLLAEASFRLRLNHFAEAERLLREAQLLAPKRGDVAGMLGSVLASQRRFEESIEAFAKAIGAEPNAIRHRQELGFALLSFGRPDRAAEAFLQALRVDPYDQLSLAGLTVAYREQGDGRCMELVDLNRHVGIFDLFEGETKVQRIDFHRQLAEELRQLHTMEVEPIDQTLRGGTQTTCVLFEQPSSAVADLRRRIERAVGDFIGQMPRAAAHPFVGRKASAFAFTGSWSCRLRSGGFHTNHIHPMGWISSAYYVTVPPSAEDAERHPGWLALGQSNLGLGERDRPERLIQPVMGQLVVFPSYCWHGTIPFPDVGERLTVAFDVVPVEHSSPD